MDAWSSLEQCTTILSEVQIKSDRLSCLPDHLLIRILSLLPTKYALVVCVLLNKRMLLPWLTSLDFDASPICHCLIDPNQIERFPLFQNFVDFVLQTHQSAYLTRFQLNLGVSSYCVRTPHYFMYGHDVGCLPHLKPTQINAWIRFPLNHCGLRELDLNVHLRGPPCQTPLPPEVFMKETLEVLKLDVNLSFDGISIFCLPNLKTLHLRASIIYEDAFLSSLVSSCPVLEELKFSAWWNHVHITKISSQSLRRLSLSMLKLEHGDNSDLVILDTPNLENLVYLDNVALQYSITSMPRLVKAEIDFNLALEMESPEVSCQRLLIFIRALSNVHHLALHGVILQVLNYMEENKQLPVFHDLILLDLAMSNFVRRNTLMAFLYRSPNLNTLVFSGRLSGGRDETHDFTQATIPWCCKFHLKRVLVYDFSGSEEVILYIQFLLKYSSVLEELVILSEGPATHESQLQNLPRASPTCSIQWQLLPFGPFPQLY